MVACAGGAIAEVAAAIVVITGGSPVPIRIIVGASPIVGPSPSVAAEPAPARIIAVVGPSPIPVASHPWVAPSVIVVGPPIGRVHVVVAPIGGPAPPVEVYHAAIAEVVVAVIIVVSAPIGLRPVEQRVDIAGVGTHALQGDDVVARAVYLLIMAAVLPHAVIFVHVAASLACVSPVLVHIVSLNRLWVFRRREIQVVLGCRPLGRQSQNG